MKPGLEVGYTECIQIKVTPDMFAQFEGTIVHPVYSTVSMVYHMEWASRKIILPFLEDDEEGMGGAVTVKHLAPSLEGSMVTVKAILKKMDRNYIITEVMAENEHGVIGTGEVKQVIVPKAKLQQLFNRG
ncbi:thioesterase [Bacillus sp. 31A1R]|uniref:Thioesterase n=1 Tax=Robertmurraya mangrovi TaxID=3098077 RepID=A0ABU5J063_9BACI|nr:thioesterase [Bacillus sp. 31A1R]MDZ5472781.1 thioesterase [Bacillus sp. 31A1R]